jgi:hypothetical protein
MNSAPHKFAQLLTKAIHRIKTERSQRVKEVQDELGFDLGRETGGSVIEYWRKGNLPSSYDELEKLAFLLVRSKGLLTDDEVQEFLAFAGYPYPQNLSGQLFPQDGGPAHILPDPTGGGQSLGAFVVGPPILHPSQFYGREADLARIFTIFSHFPLQHVAITGPRRSGKTSLLHYLKNLHTTPSTQLRPGQRQDWLKRPERYRWIFVDFQDPAMRRQEALLGHLLAGLGAPGVQADLSSFISAARSRLVGPTILLMDEIDSALASPHLDQAELWDCLRSLASNSAGGNLGFVVASRSHLSDLFLEHGLTSSPFFNIFGHMVEMKPLDESEARHLIAASPQPFSDDEMDWILQESAGWPFLVQMLCSELLDLKNRAPETLVRRVAEEPGSTYAAAPAQPDWKQAALDRIAPYRYLLE